MEEPGHPGGMERAKVQTFAAELAKHSVKQRETMMIGGGGECPLCHPAGSATALGNFLKGALKQILYNILY